MQPLWRALFNAGDTGSRGQPCQICVSLSAPSWDIFSFLLQPSFDIGASHWKRCSLWREGVFTPTTTLPVGPWSSVGIQVQTMPRATHLQTLGDARSYAAFTRNVWIYYYYFSSSCNSLLTIFVHRFLDMRSWTQSKATIGPRWISSLLLQAIMILPLKRNDE